MKTRRILFCCTFAFSVILEYLVRTHNWWSGFGGHMDSVMHLFWGLNIFLIAIVWFRWKPLTALHGVFAFQMLWELAEIIGDIVIPQSSYMMDLFWWDGIKDTIVDMLGAILAWWVLARIPGGLDGLRETRYAGMLQRLPLAMIPGVVLGGVIWSRTGSSPQLFGIAWITLAFAYSFWKSRTIDMRTM